MIKNFSKEEIDRNFKFFEFSSVMINTSRARFDRREFKTDYKRILTEFD